MATFTRGAYAIQSDLQGTSAYANGASVKSPKKLMKAFTIKKLMKFARNKFKNMNYRHV